jgi:hypothetical protein
LDVLKNGKCNPHTDKLMFYGNVPHSGGYEDVVDYAGTSYLLRNMKHKRLNRVKIGLLVLG